MIPIASPDLSGNESQNVAQCLESTWISSAGRFISEFEDAFAKVAGTRHAVATNNGTTALHLALVAAGVGPGDEVIVPALTYIATANAVRYCGATPVFADVVADTMNIDPADIEHRITERTKVVVPVHLYGHPADMSPIMEVAQRHGLTVIEDAAEAHASRIDGRPVGSIGHLGVFSFFGNKIVTTGEGGAVTTDDDEMAARLRLLRGQGMDPQRRYWFPVVGFNYRMTNVAAAIGVAQIERIDALLARRTQIARLYTDLLAGAEGIALPVERPNAQRVDWLYTVQITGFTSDQRNRLIDLLAEDGIETRPVFYPLHLMPPYESTPALHFPVAEQVGAEGISLPTHTLLSDEDVRTVTDALVARVAQLRA
ncbi:DegT/DnrJ/EryC1/StrS family aminotransferase [Cellulomonas soli]|uniref:GDP-perosamine synthase n=1 Tax=Cellulomonas soli TaxID=931535 RepID=A0A512P7Z9_9CELL|nr:DegT/DnrJ/EryC1/StrS family aminotransferase [Cellulomonas soli]NYI57550.1 perosamine synthetase [Cellulomonas soli]GEP67327.1 GDP-perosamine synthase [Cellulomonas soli]